MSTPLNELPEHAHAHLRQAAQPEWLNPTLATLVHEPFSDPDWLFEPKLDGERCLIFKRGGQVRVMSRKRKELAVTYPEIARAVAEQVEHDGVLDGEIVAFDGRRTSFARLQQRMQLEQPGGSAKAQVPIYWYLFDIPHLDDHDLTAVPLRDRKKVLSRIANFRDPLRMTPHENADGADYYRRACRAGSEGALAKDATRGYAQGRSRAWLKFKCAADQELVVGGYTDPTGQRPELGALLVGYYEGGRFIYAGKVGTGFDESTLRDLRQRLSTLERGRSPFVEDVDARGVHWTHPDLVVEIAFTEWTRDGKLRHPSFVGLRQDKDPGEVTRERAVT